MRRAIEGFAGALEAAERGGLGDLIATAALNVGTAQHQLGDWGAALASYRRGLRSAVAHAKRRTETTLRFNLAKLYADIGAVERARAMTPHVEESEAELYAGVLGLRAEIETVAGSFDEASELLARARRLHAARGAQRELCECDLQACELALQRDEVSAASRHLEAAERALDGLDAVDLELRHRVLRARVALAGGDTQTALSRLDGARELEVRAAQRSLSAEHAQACARAYRESGATVLEERARKNALAHWEHIASTLPSELKSAFWSQPPRGDLRRDVALPHASLGTAVATQAARQADDRALRMRRLVEVNRTLTSTLDLDEVLRLAIDAAIELTGAERGFLVLKNARAAAGYDVPVARNIDRERIGKSHNKLSQSIAERVLRDGDPVLTVDAQQDDRFSGNVSVHAMRLRSIACVPVRAHGAVLGALYLDNRFQPGRFASGEIDLLFAFADQLAIALHNGRLLRELRQRTRELEREKRRVEDLSQARADEIDRLQRRLQQRLPARGERYAAIIGESVAMRRVFAILDRVVDRDVSVLISGESGTGKELIARAIHDSGARSDGPFVALNCAALPEPLLESELFGHIKGAFTGATRDHQGLLVAARGGTLFLDELGEMPLGMQVKLLRVLQERLVRPVGATATVAIEDVRILCATNRRLRDEVAAGNFREDLYYRIAVVDIELPPLRERVEDIPALARAIIEKHAAGTPWKISRPTMRKLLSYSWPGNVRQLENTLVRATVMAGDSTIEPADIELPTRRPPVRAASRESYVKAEAERIREALSLHRWNVSEVSRALAIPRTSLYRKMRAMGLHRSA